MGCEPPELDYQTPDFRERFHVGARHILLLGIYQALFWIANLARVDYEGIGGRVFWYFVAFPASLLTQASIEAPFEYPTSARRWIAFIAFTTLVLAQSLLFPYFVGKLWERGRDRRIG